MKNAPAFYFLLVRGCKTNFVLFDLRFRKLGGLLLRGEADTFFFFFFGTSLEFGVTIRLGC